MRFRTFFSAGLAAKQDFFRHYHVGLYMPDTGTPTRKQVRKLLKKFFDKEEAAVLDERMVVFHDRSLFFDRLSQAKAFVKAVGRLCRDKEDPLESDVQKMACPYFFAPEFGRFGAIYTRSDDLSVCASCGRPNPSCFRSEEGLRSRCCGATLVMLTSLKPKEIRKRVEALRKGNGNPETVTAEFDDLAA